MRGSTLYCKLPSGRFLKYTQAQTEFIKTPYGVEKEVVTYMGVDSFTKKYTRLKSYGGKLTENITQAISRDILAFSMLTVESEGYPVVMHVHDEVVCEIDEAVGSLKQFEELMAMTPYWAEGLPLRAEGWRGKRYRK
jgi:DNA polymerase